MNASMRKYGRGDIDFDTFYSPWMKTLAANYTVDELKSLLAGKRREATAGAKAHLRAIEATGSMQGHSARRAHGRNVVEAAGEYSIALVGALEIHELFPERALARVGGGK